MPNTQNTVNNHEYRSVPVAALIALSATSREGAGRRAEAHREGEVGHHGSASRSGHDPSTCIRSFEEGGFVDVAHYRISRLSYNQIPEVAKRHKVEVKKESDSGQELLAKQVGNYDETELCRVLLEISLLDSAYRLPPSKRSTSFPNTPASPSLPSLLL